MRRAVIQATRFGIGIGGLSMRQNPGPTSHRAWMLVLLIASAALPELAIATDPIILQGTVTDRANGIPIANVGVLTSPTNVPITTTDANGSYFIAASQLSQGTGTLFYQSAGYYVASANYDVTTMPETLDATLLPGGAVIQGAVTDADTQAGIAGATLNFRFTCTAGSSGQCSLLPSGASTTSDAGGQYSIDSSQLIESGIAGLQLIYDSVLAATYSPHVDNGLAIPLVDPLPLRRDFALAHIHDISFQDVTAQSGINFTGRSFGASWGDFNGDGWADLYTGNHKSMGSLWLNNRDGTFSNIFPSHWTNPTTPDKHGAAWADFDNDGDQDLMEVTGAGEGTGSVPKMLMVNNGGTMTNQAVAFGVTYPLGRGRTPLWLDWNNDGLLDVFMSNQARPDGQAPSALFLQSGGVFAIHDLGLSPKLNSLFAQSSQLLGDGRRMLIIHSSDSYPGPIFAIGVEPAVSLNASLKIPTTTNVWDVAIEDFNGDLRPDFFLANLNNTANESILTDSRTLKTSFNVNKAERGVKFVCGCTLTFTLGPSWDIKTGSVYVGAVGAHPRAIIASDSSVHFTESATDATVAGIAPHTPASSSGLYIGYDAPTQTWTMLTSNGNSRFAFNVMINSSADIANLVPVNLNASILPLRDRLLLNTGSGFVDASNQPALTVTRACASAAAGDFDNDMDVDIYLVCRGKVQNLPNVLLENDGTGVFKVVPLAGGAEGTTAGRGEIAAMADFDNDGFLDLFVTNGEGEVPFTNGPYQLFRNTTNNGNHWLEIDLQGVQSNRGGVGAKVIVTAGGKAQVREQNGGVHRYAQNFRPLHFGLAGNTVVTTITIYWPSGIVQTLTGVAADQILKIIESPPSP